MTHAYRCDARPTASLGARCALALLTAAATACAHATALISLTVDERGSGAAKPLVMTAREIERAPDHSILQVDYVSGASVPSSLFSMRATCEVARARRWQQVAIASLAAAGHAGRYRLTPAAAPDGRSISLAQCQALGL